MWTARYQQWIGETDAISSPERLRELKKVSKREISIWYNADIKNGEETLFIMCQVLDYYFEHFKITMKYSLIFVYSTCPRWFYEQVGRRKLGSDPFRHGRFTIIVNRGFIAFIKQDNGTLYKLHPLLTVQYKIQWLSYTFGSVLRGKYLKKSLKNQWFRAWHYRKEDGYESN